MPIISMFYGIIIRLYLLDNKHHNLPHIHQSTLSSRHPLASVMVKFFPESCLASRFGWFRHG